MYAYAGAAALPTNPFKVKVACPTLGTPTITGSPFTYTVPFTDALSKTQFLAGTSYVTSTSSAATCALTYAV